MKLTSDCRAATEEKEPIVVKEKAKVKLKTGLGVARMTGSVMAGVDVEEKLERELPYKFYLYFASLLVLIMLTKRGQVK